MKGIKNRVLASMPKEEKVELQSEKIELGALDEVNDSIKSLEGYVKSNGDWSKIVMGTLKEYFKTEDKYKKAKDELEADVKDAVTTAKNTKGQISRAKKSVSAAKASIKKAERAAKELGLKANDLPAVKTLNKLIDRNEDLIKKLSTNEEALQSFTDRHK